LAAGIDRGLVEGFMGHVFALDSFYLRMTDDELEQQYMKVVDRLTFLTTPQLVAALDETIEAARKNSQVKDDSRLALHWTKTLRDLVEVRNNTLLSIKAHILGRNETRAVVEPENYYDSDSEIMFERTFHTFLTPWTLEDLKLKCEDCGRENDEVSRHVFPEHRDRNKYVNGKRLDLCPECYDKRAARGSGLEHVGQGREDRQT
jgi:hypothetical protein